MSMTRRGFLARSVVSAGAAGVAATAARAVTPLNAVLGLSSGILGANDKIRLGLIGCGGIAHADLGCFLKHKEVECPIICDIDDSRIADLTGVIEKARGTKPEGVKDFRRIIDRKDIDAVLVATPDHWHALPTIHACQAGKDVYCEKPLATSIGEGAAMLAAARKYDRVVQMGTQWRSGPHYAEAVDYVHSGKLGKIRQIRCWAYLHWAGDAGNTPDGPEPDGVDYDMWLGPAPKRPFNEARFHFKFRWFWDYAGGLMTDWGVHLLNVAMWALKYPTPKMVNCTGGKYKLVDDLSETPDTQVAMYDFGDYSLIWEHHSRAGAGLEGREHGIAIWGDKGKLILDAHGWEVGPIQAEKGEVEKHAGKNDGRQTHVGNFLDCMRSRERCVEDFEVGHRISTIAHLGNLALRSGRSIQWNAENERVTDNDDANRLLTAPYRAPWKLPT